LLNDLTNDLNDINDFYDKGCNNCCSFFIPL
jgi:hypothetical protein